MVKKLKTDTPRFNNGGMKLVYHVRSQVMEKHVHTLTAHKTVHIYLSYNLLQN